MGIPCWGDLVSDNVRWLLVGKDIENQRWIGMDCKGFFLVIGTDMLIYKKCQYDAND